MSNAIEPRAESWLMKIFTTEDTEDTETDEKERVRI